MAFANIRRGLVENATAKTTIDHVLACSDLRTDSVENPPIRCELLVANRYELTRGAIHVSTESGKVSYPVFNMMFSTAEAAYQRIDAKMQIQQCKRK